MATAPDAGTKGPNSVAGKRRLLVGLLAVPALVAMGWVAVDELSPVVRPTAGTMMRLAFAPPLHAAFAAEQAPAVSRDGSHVAFVAGGPEGTRLWVREVGDGSTRPLAGTEGAALPFWSPSGTWVGFFAQGKLKTVPVDGGRPVTLGEAPLPRGASWNDRDLIVFAPGGHGPLYRIPAAGGLAVQVTTLDAAAGETSHRWPQFLPDGRHFVFLALTSRPEAWVSVGALAEHLHRHLFAAGASATYAAPGSLLYVGGESLLAQRFDPNVVAVVGSPVRVADGVAASSLSQTLASAAANVLVYASSADVDSELVVFDGQGRETVLDSSGRDSEPAISPDGGRAAFTRIDPSTGEPDVWLVDLRRQRTTRLTSDSSADMMPLWFLRGDSLVFSSNRLGHYDLYEKRIASGGEEALLLPSGESRFPVDWAPDGRFLLVEKPTKRGDLETWALMLDGKPGRLILPAQLHAHGARISRDGRLLAYVSNEAGPPEVFVRPFGGPVGTSTRVSDGGGFEPAWSRSALFYLTADGSLIEAQIEAGPAVVVRSRRSILRTGIDPTEVLRVRNHYAVSPDGKTFLLTRPAARQDVALEVFLNWQAALNGP